MDENSDVSQVQRSDSEPVHRRALVRIDPTSWNKDRLWWLWCKVEQQDYAFEDPAKAAGWQFFLAQLFHPQSEVYEYGDEGLAAFLGIVPQSNANFHWLLWGEVDISELVEVQRELFTDVFKRHKLARITGMIPAFNKPAIRLAQLCRFKYEGEMRQAFLKNGKSHNIQIYGLTWYDFFVQEVKN